MSEEAESRLQSKAITAADDAARHLPASFPPAFFLTDPARTPFPEKIARGLPQGWGVIYRHFGAEDRFQMAEILAGICRERGLRFLISADAELAQSVKADGVHWPYRLRENATIWRKYFRLQTISAHSEAELSDVQILPVDAVIVSAIFPSTSPSAGPALGVERFREMAASSRLPVYGLGGITPENAGQISAFAGLAAVDGWKCFAQA